MQKFNFYTLITVFIIAGLTACGESDVTVTNDSTDKTKKSYSIGYDYGSNLNRMGVTDIEIAATIQGLKDGLNDQRQLDEQEMIRVLTELNQEIMDRRQKEALAADSDRKALSESNKAEGDAFLAENLKKEGVQVTNSGLQYKVIKAGTGKSPKASDKVRVHYEGRLLNGDIFDSSYKRNEPAEFQLNGVIKGWTEGLQLMKEGATYEFYIKPELAYSLSGAGQKIGPNATLIFKVELLEVK